GGPLQFAARLGGPLLVVGCAALAGGALAEITGSAWAVATTDSHAPVTEGAQERPYLVVALLSLVSAAVLAGAGAGAAPSAARPASSRARAGAAATQSLRVAIVQGGGKRGLNQLQVPPIEVYEAAVHETRQVRAPVQLILWPEDVVALGTTPFAGSPEERSLAAIAHRYNATLVAGVTEDVGTSRFRNEVVAFGPSGRLVATFEKRHRVPFGEYIPLRSFFSHLANLADVPRDAIPGTGTGMIATPAGRLAVLVSYEVFFASRGRGGVSAGGRLIVVPTNTSSYSNDQAPSQEIAASRLQALEEGRYVLQAAPTGYSAVIAPSGAVLQRSGLASPAEIEARVELLSADTPYEQGGDLPVLGLALLALVGGWLASETVRRRSPRTRRLPHPQKSPSRREGAPPT
ncbi:MAG: apolipoprotein N-acyltransferase, partial [Acidimicrobiales bacterium]